MTQFSSLYGSYLDEELGTDDAAILFTTARRKSAINKGASAFANITDCLARTTSFTPVSGATEYNLNSTTVLQDGDFQNFDVRGLEVTLTDASSNTTILAGRDGFVQRSIDWLNQEEPGWDLPLTSTGAQNPRYWYVRADGGQLLVGFAPPLQFSTGTTVRVKVPYIADAPKLVSDTDQPFTFNGSVRTDLSVYHQGLVHYAAHQLEKLRQDAQASDRQLQKFMGYVAQYVSDQRIKGGRQIRQARAYFKRRSGAWSAERVWTGR